MRLLDVIMAGSLSCEASNKLGRTASPHNEYPFESWEEVIYCKAASVYSPHFNLTDGSYAYHFPMCIHHGLLALLGLSET